MIATVVRVRCSVCGRIAHGTAPLGWQGGSKLEALSLDEQGWQFAPEAEHTPADESLPTVWRRRILCPVHRERFAQIIPSADERREFRFAEPGDGAE